MSNTTTLLTPTQRFWRMLKPDQKEITNVYIYSIFNGLVNLSLPLGIQAIINLIQGGQVNTSWILLVSFVVVGVGASGLLQISQLRITEHLQQKIFTRAAFEFAFRIPRIRMEAIYKHYAPELMNRFFDTISVQKGLSKIVIDFSSATLQIIFGLILLSFYHSFFILFSILLIAMVYVIMRLSIPRGMKTSLVESKHKYAVVHWLEEVARTATTFKLASSTDLPMKQTNVNTENYVNARDAHFKVLLRHYYLMVVFKVLVVAGLLIIGGILVMEQRMNIGQFVAAELIILLVMASVEKLILSIETIYDVLTSLEKIGQVTDLELDRRGGHVLDDGPNSEGLAIKLKDVVFRYPGHDLDTLQSLNLEIEAGERVLIQGPNGAGKSSLLQVLGGLYDPREGSVVFDGQTKSSLDLTSIQEAIGDCLSQEQLFQGTLYENITMGRDVCTWENVKWAVKNLMLEDFVNSLPQGYDTIIEPQGRRLPRSIIQKLILARSITDKPRLLLLEDAFEHLDQKERHRIIDFLLNRENSWTVIAVSQSNYFASVADRVIRMENGQVIPS